MEIVEFSNSSAVAKVSFDNQQKEVGVAYNYKPDVFYIFKCDDVDSVKNQIQQVESVGKFISQLKKDGTLISV